ncbi:transcription antitermination factor NusB [Dissulfurimicrobium hydrothermale]|uniref:transcription antitermination factor NusB n=1 Tax=Dissulfurimicrobium hydrothermale TaxID=1750598 RepID=UPI001EDC3CA8|nr:transcription antitermination factor NusB [Dissulfurimicrobium hydrothermale]UKL12847.1 transcription antitermination factor NusB [Dissulfurimicrobium hydrothermale]
MSSRRLGREIALQLLYQAEWDPSKDGRELIDEYRDGLSAKTFEKDDVALSFAEDLITGIFEHRRELDNFISKKAKGWRFDRIALVDRNILRLGVFELCYCRDIPPKVAINEAVELAKRFGSDDSAAFINGILDAILKEIDGIGQGRDGI